MKFTIYGYNQSVLLEYGLTFDDVVILKIISSLYFSHSEKINSIFYENCKYIWLTYNYIHSEIPVIGTERTLINKISSLVKKGFLKKIVRNTKNGKTGKFMFLALGENYNLLTDKKSTDSKMKVLQETNEKTSSKQVQNFHIKDQVNNDQYNNIKNKYIKPQNFEPFILDILKKYKELGLPDYEILPSNNIFINCIQALGAEKLLRALELMGESSYVMKNFSIDMIFNIKNLKKALNGTYKDKFPVKPKENHISENLRFTSDKVYTPDFDNDSLFRALGIR